MLRYIDKTEAINEPKSARMEQRTKPHVKHDIQAAAALLGVDETAFVTNAAYERACAVIRDHERTKLTAEDREMLLEALDNPAQPTKVLRDAYELHQEVVVNDGPVAQLVRANRS